MANGKKQSHKKRKKSNSKKDDPIKVADKLLKETDPITHAVIHRHLMYLRKQIKKIEANTKRKKPRKKRKKRPSKRKK